MSEISNPWEDRPQQFQPGNTVGHRFTPGHTLSQGGMPLARNEWAIRARKQEVIRLLLEGAKGADIQALVGISPMTYYTYLKDPEVRQQLNELNSMMLKTLDQEIIERSRTKAEIVDELAYIALGEMRTILQDKTAHIGVRAKMIDSVLDRTPELSRTKKLDVTSRTFSMKAEDLLAAASVAREIDERERLKEAEAQAGPDSEQNLVRE